jgi:periplasmic copper chaperone A
MRIAMISATLLITLPLAGCGGPATHDGAVATADQPVTAMGATMRVNANPAAPSAAYFTLVGGARDTVLTGASSPDLERAELHEAMVSGGMASMAPLARLPIPAGENVIFRTGGRHVMLFGMSDAARAAGQLMLTLTFADSPPVEVMLVFPEAPQASTPPPQAATASPPVAAPASTPVAAPPATASTSRRTVPVAPLAVPPEAAPAPAATPAPAAPAPDPHAGHDMHTGH